MSLLSRLFQRSDPKEAMAPLYAAIVAEGRRPHWYLDGAVPDTLDGRFDMIAAILCQVLLRLEREDAKQQSVWLTEIFVDDMDGQLRQIGIGDMIVGKHIGRMMSALGGRLAAYRDGLAPGGNLDEALVRNIWRGAAPDPQAVSHVATRLRQVREELEALPVSEVLAGKLVR